MCSTVLYCTSIVLYFSFEWLAFNNLSLVCVAGFYLYSRKELLKLNHNIESIVVYCIVLYVSFKWLGFNNLSLVCLVGVFLY